MEIVTSPDIFQESRLGKARTRKKIHHPQRDHVAALSLQGIAAIPPGYAVSSAPKTATLDVIRHSCSSCEAEEEPRSAEKQFSQHCANYVMSPQFWRRFKSCRVATLLAPRTPPACSPHGPEILRYLYRSCNQPVWEEHRLQYHLNVVRTAKASDQSGRSSAVRDTPFEQGDSTFRSNGGFMHFGFLNSVAANSLDFFILSNRAQSVKVFSYPVDVAARV